MLDSGQVGGVANLPKFVPDPVWVFLLSDCLDSRTIPAWFFILQNCSFWLGRNIVFGDDKDDKNDKDEKDEINDKDDNENNDDNK